MVKQGPWKGDLTAQCTQPELQDKSLCDFYLVQSHYNSSYEIEMLERESQNWGCMHRCIYDMLHGR